MKSSKTLFKRLMILAAVALLVCSFMVSCGGQAAQKTFSGNVKLNDGEGITQENLNKIATFMLNNPEAYEGVVAAYRGYNILNPGFEVEVGASYEAKTKLEQQPALDDKGAIKLDENGNPIYVTVEVPDVDLEAAKAVLAKADASLPTSVLDEQDIINLVDALKYAVTFEAQRGFFDNIMYGIGVALGWIVKTVGFGNYIVGICIFAIIIEIIMLPLAIKRHKNSIKQAKLRPKEMAIRKKYAGRNDQATQQKIQMEINEMYQKENFNPASGCLPLLLQLPVLLILYNIVVDPLKHVLGISGNMSSALQTYYATSPLAGGFGGRLTQAANGTGSIEALSKIGDVAIEKLEGIKSFVYFTNGSDAYAKLAEIHEQIPSFNIGNTNFGLIPSFKDFGWLLLIPLLTFIVYFASSKLTRKFMYQPTTADNPQMGCSNNMMDIMMPAMSVYFCFLVPAAVGVYWMFKSILSTLQQFILTKIMPLPVFSEEEYKAAERELAGKAPKSGSRAPRDPNAPKARSLHHIDDEDYDENGNYKPVEHTEEEKPAEAAPTALPEGAAPLKEDAPERREKKKGNKKDDTKTEEAKTSEEEKN